MLMSMRAYFTFRLEPKPSSTIYGVSFEAEKQGGAMQNPEDYLQDIQLSPNSQFKLSLWSLVNLTFPG